jgi:hypothetical protein
VEKLYRDVLVKFVAGGFDVKSPVGDSLLAAVVDATHRSEAADGVVT